MRDASQSPVSARVIHTVILLYLGLPVLGTLLYSLATRWDSTLLPAGWTLRWYVQIFTDPQVTTALWHSLAVAVATVILLWLLVTPALFVGYVYLPGMRRLLDAAALVPFALPPVILAVGLIQIYSRKPLSLAGTPWILIFTYCVICLPYMTGAIGNGFAAINARTLVEAAESLGAGRAYAFWRVILPNLVPGLLSSGLLTFAVALGEFVIANMLVGGGFETLQIRLVQAMRFNGHLASALVIFFFVLVALASTALVRGVHQLMGGPSSTSRRLP